MPYFLSDKNLKLGERVQLSGEEARHILLSHRIKIGEKVKLQGPDGKRFLSEVIKADKKTLTVKNSESLSVPEELKNKITLFQAVVSEKALDIIFQKATELGAAEIVLFNSEKTATKISPELFKKKEERWNKILIEASKQSERSVWPKLSFARDLDSAIKLMIQKKIFLADALGAKPLPLNSKFLSLALLVGPEGGFSEQEIKNFQSLPNLKTISLGNFVLRAETAAIAGITILQSQD